MGRKIFVSYKYADRDVEDLPDRYKVQDPRDSWQTTTLRSYVDKLQDLLDRKDHINKGERNNEDLSHLSEETITQKFKTKIHNSNVTIVFISPKMKEPLKKERDQWIPWEISYSLKDIVRNGQRSRTNAILAVVLPDRNASYNYFEYSDGSIKKDNLFSILANNMDNIQPYVLTNEKNFIKTIKWDSFIGAINNYIEKAVQIKKNINEYNVIRGI